MVLGIAAFLVAVLGETFSQVVGSLAGAMFAAAAAIASVLMRDQLDEKKRAISKREESQRRAREYQNRLEKIKTLITAELTAVAAALLQVKRRGHVFADRDEPPAMPSTDNLGSELLALEKQQIDALATSRLQLQQTRMIMADKTRTGPLTRADEALIRDLMDDDMNALSTLFELIAPSLEIQLPNEEPEIAFRLLRKMAGDQSLWRNF
jgi:hypothetical protein